MSTVDYPAIIERRAVGYGASFPDLPGCGAAGLSLTETVMRAKAALHEYLAGMTDRGSSFPYASKIDALKRESESLEVCRVVFPTPPPPSEQGGRVIHV